MRVEGAKLADSMPKPVEILPNASQSQNASPQVELPMDSLFEEEETEDDFTFENDYYEEKLDEALRAAERLKEESDKLAASQEDDDLDVPAFMRNGMKDLSLD